MKQNEFDRYEFMLFEGNQIMVNREIPKLQSEGWRLAGNVSTKYSNQAGSADRMLIPLKRLLTPSAASYFDEYYQQREREE